MNMKIPFHISDLTSSESFSPCLRINRKASENWAHLSARKNLLLHYTSVNLVRGQQPKTKIRSKDSTVVPKSTLAE